MGSEYCLKVALWTRVSSFEAFASMEHFSGQTWQSRRSQPSIKKLHFHSILDLSRSEFIGMHTHSQEYQMHTAEINAFVKAVSLINNGFYFWPSFMYDAQQYSGNRRSRRPQIWPILRSNSFWILAWDVRMIPRNSIWSLQLVPRSVGIPAGGATGLQRGQDGRINEI